MEFFYVSCRANRVIDRTEHYIREPGKIVGIFLKMLHDADKEYTALSENGE